MTLEESMQTSSGLGVALLIAACGGSSIGLDSFATELQTRRCEVLVACNAAPDQATCMAANPVDTKTLTLVAAAKTNAVSYDGEQASSCLAQIAGAGCLQSNAYDLYTVVVDKDSNVPWYACSAIFTSTRTSGACFFDEECSGDYGYRCRHSADCTTDCCAGTCGISGTDTCARDSDCVAGFLCGPDGLCVSGSEGAPCSGGSPCSPGLECDLSHTCSRRPAAGAACNTVSFGGPPGCDDVGDVCGPSLPGTCIAGPTAGNACIGDQCAFDASCDANNQCQRKPVLGEPCMVGSLTSPCLAPLVCSGGTSGSVGTCTAPSATTCQDRMGRTGARWSLSGAEAVLRLRALRTSGDFDDYWQFHVAQEHERTHASRYADGDVSNPLPVSRSHLTLVK